MNVRVCTVDGLEHEWSDAKVLWDTTIVQIANKHEVITFPLVNVLYYVTSESDTS
jgi:RNA polymerase subunit RPABC4/transcription elongation factor Spt4